MPPNRSSPMGSTQGDPKLSRRANCPKWQRLDTVRFRRDAAAPAPHGSGANSGCKEDQHGDCGPELPKWSLISHFPSLAEGEEPPRRNPARSYRKLNFARILQESPLPPRGDERGASTMPLAHP